MDTRQLVAYNYMFKKKFYAFGLNVVWIGSFPLFISCHLDTKNSYHISSCSFSTSLATFILSFVTTPSNLPLNLPLLLIRSTQQLIRYLGHLHILDSLRNLCFFLVKHLLDDG